MVKRIPQKTESNKLQHKLSDHDFGIFNEHIHKPGHHYDHDHDEDFDEGPLEDNPLWQQDNIFLSTVGIDVGSSSTQVVFSKIHLERQGEALSSRYIVVDRCLLYQSPIFFTPYSETSEIDAQALGALIDQAYAEAGFSPRDVDIGVVLMTGEALRRDNAEVIAHVIAHKGGEFLSASAGHHMESNLAAHGSGAVELSGQNTSCVLNVDIGGGTTKLALIRNGSLAHTAAFHVGGRLMVWNDDNEVVRIEPRAFEILTSLGHAINLGDKVSPSLILLIGKTLAKMVADIALGRECLDAKWLTDPIKIPPDLDTIIFSGGVSEYIADTKLRGQNDLGQSLGVEIRKIFNKSKADLQVLASPGGIRATALGASEFNIQVSGNTGYLSDPALLLPRRNLPVIRLVVDSEILTVDHLVENLFYSFREFNFTDYSDVALAFEWHGEFDYHKLKTFCEAINAYLVQAEFHKHVYLLFDRDLAQSIGRILVVECKMNRPLLALDGLRFKEFEFVDLGRIRLPSRTVPVTVKSLLFQSHGMS